MISVKGHFDVRSIVLDEPATLAVGQTVRVVVVDDVNDPNAKRRAERWAYLDDPSRDVSNI